ncbi:uncharacterized protein LOC126176479 [Schistocerca cancellata]|uniref:uncharacterized protein LOC126176479 n=1 Tax=Schistocerca cancellata TaxID=274614 RepID=UPI0021193FEE|nr:uncharacterized protein LOC126176479 [Schistocerca cancellata]XP_049779599.1 uncharacterized protein LOC126176479 [Schistocerca cancellata]
MMQLSQYSDKNLLCTVYHGLFKPYLQYGVTVWGNSNKQETKRVFRLQKKAIRTILRRKTSETCRNCFKNLDILTFSSLYIYKTIMYITKGSEDWITNASVHTHNTRKKNEVRSIPHRLAGLEKGPQYSGIRLLRSLPKTLQDSVLHNDFPKKLKDYLIGKEFYSVAEYLCH